MSFNAGGKSPVQGRFGMFKGMEAPDSNKNPPPLFPVTREMTCSMPENLPLAQSAAETRPGKSLPGARAC
jgi:hypothetical protein